MNPFAGTWSVALVNSNRDLALTSTPALSAIPEPSTYAALLAAGLLRRRVATR